MIAPSPPDFSTDRPLTARDQDRLSRAPFVDRVARVLRNLPKGGSLVIGVHGPWGDGKTTALNLLRAELAGSDDVVVRDFNPWRLTDEEAMLHGFFVMLADAINASLSTVMERTKRGTGKWIKRVRIVTRMVGRIFKPAETVDEMLAKLGEVVASGDSVGLEELRGRIVARLGQSGKRIVVLIDDIDRLDKHETYTLFRLIKACADFPNVCYVLAFDDMAVGKALGERYGGGDELAGRAFLEKIIQVPLKLPVAAREDLRALCFEHVDRALTAAGVELTQEQVGEFIAGFDRGILVRLTTPRAANRFGNALMFALPMLKGEVNMADLLLVEALRAFFPQVYDTIRDNHAEFSGVVQERHADRNGGPRAVRLLKPILDQMPKEHADAAASLVVDLFPRLSGTLYPGSGYGNDWLPRWSREQRISAPDYCARYFTYAIPNNDIPDAEVTALLKDAERGDSADLRARVRAHLTGPKACRFIEKLRAREDVVDRTAAEVLAVVLAGLGAVIPNPAALFSFAEPPSEAGILISHLLRRIASRAERLAAAKRVMEIADPLWFGAECLRWLYVTDKPERQDQNTLTAGEFAATRTVLVERIKVRAANGVAFFDPGVRQEDSLLFEWSRAEGRDPVQTHLIKIFTQDGRQVANFLQSNAPQAWRDGAAVPHVSDLRADALKRMKLLIELDILAEWIRRTCPGDFENPSYHHDDSTPLDQRLAEQFMFVYNKWKKNGEPRDNAAGETAEAVEAEGGDLAHGADEDENAAE
ncbi:MAG: P-loop NTPase fold protein [Sulfurifustis sp.]